MVPPFFVTAALLSRPAVCILSGVQDGHLAHLKEDRMKLRMLAVAAGFALLPVIAGAQTPTDSTKRDTTMAPMTTSTSSTMPMAAKDSSLEPKPVPPSDGKTCPWGCPTSKGAAGLTGPQFLALQQELRDRKCGLAHVTGRLDAATRTAIRNCAKKLGTANNAGALLVGMGVGYTAADISSGSGPSGEE